MKLRGRGPGGCGGRSSCGWSRSSEPREYDAATGVDGGITRWLGADAEDTEPAIAQRRVEGAGWLLLCTDGLWSEISDASVQALVVDAKGSAPLGIARRLIAAANEAGARDNVSVVVVPSALQRDTNPVLLQRGST